MGRNGYGARFVSANSDNRKFCPAIQRPKFCYETYEKAKKACEYSDNPQRVYYCKFCCAYHTTHFLKKSYEGAEGLSLRERGLQRAVYSGYKTLEYEYSTPMTPAMGRVLKKDYHPVVKKYLIEYLDRTKDDVSLSDAELRSAFSEILKDEDVELLTEMLKWPFCDVESAMIFYALYYIQEKKFYYGEKVDDILRQLFNTNDFSDELRKAFNKLFYTKQIIVTNEDSSGKRFKFESFALKPKKKSLQGAEVPDDDGDDIYIRNALNADYHPVVKEYLVRHLRNNRLNEQMLEGEELEQYINDSILLHPDDEKARSAVEETTKWRFTSEKKAWKFLALYYLSLIKEFSAPRPCGLIDQLFLRGNHSKSFIGDVRGVLYKQYDEGNLIIVGMRSDGMSRYRFKDAES